MRIVSVLVDAAVHPPLRSMIRARGFTLLELMIVVTVIAILAGIGVPQYRMALRTARFTKAKQELLMLSNEIGSFLANEGRLPLTLYEIGHGGRRDPWGVPYCYLNYSSGTGDGMDWAVSAGIVDPAVLAGGAPAAGGAAGGSSGGSSGGGGGGGGGSSSKSNGVGAIVSAAAATLSGPQVAALAHSLKGATADAPVYSSVPVDQARRRDQYLFPLNTDYDLFSLGPNGMSAASLNDPLSTDDVIRANNGGFFGVASDY